MNPLDFLKSAWSSQWVRYVVILGAGITIGAVFYPTKSIEEKISKKYEAQISTLKQQHQSEMQSQLQTNQSLSQEFMQYEKDSTNKINSLTSKVSQLESKKKTNYTKVVHPDGTIEVHETTESDTSESDTVVQQVQQEWQQKIDDLQKKSESDKQEALSQQSKQFDLIQTSYKQQIEDLEKSKTVITNPKYFGVEAGALTNKDYYGHVTYDVWGPIFLGLQAQFGGSTGAAGVGAGIRF